MIRLLVSVFVLVFAGPMWAASFTAITSSQNDGSCSKVNLPNPTSCATSSSDAPYADGSVTAFAGFGNPGVQMALASMQLHASCFALIYCLIQEGMADAEVDLAVHGQLPGTPGLLEIKAFGDSLGPFTFATMHITGLTLSNLPGPHGGSMYNFIYEQPFRISATVQGECSECPFSIVDGSAEFDAPFYIYAINLSLVGTINSPSDAQPAPEPTTLTLLGLSLGILLCLTCRAR